MWFPCVVPITAHGMALEVVQRNHKVVVGHVRSHDVVLDVRRVLYGNAHLTFLVHDIHLERGRKTMPFDDLPVVG